MINYGWRSKNRKWLHDVRVLAMHEVFKRGLKSAYLLNTGLLKIVSSYCSLILTDSFCLLPGKIRVKRQRNLRISYGKAIFSPKGSAVKLMTFISPWFHVSSLSHHHFKHLRPKKYKIWTMDKFESLNQKMFFVLRNLVKLVQCYLQLVMSFLKIFVIVWNWLKETLVSTVHVNYLKLLLIIPGL